MLSKLFPSIVRSEGARPLSLSIVAHFFAKMEKGELRIEDESTGEHLVFGRGQEVKARIRVSNPDFYQKLIFSGDIGLGESYVDGDWESPNVCDVVRWFILNIDSNPSMSGSQVATNLLVNSMAHLNRARHALRSNTIEGARRNISDHYDLGNDFFASFLDPTMMYSAAIFEEGDDLEQAQIRKLQSMADLAGVKPGQKVLEIGTGWGEFSCFLAERYGCKVSSLTISDRQYEYARAKIKARGLEGRIQVLNTDYRTFEGQFDRVFTIEVLEAVGHDFMPGFFQKCHSWLKPGGTMAHQVILSPDSRYEQFRKGIDWIQKHIFPGSLLPSVSSLLQAANCEGHEFVLRGFKDMGMDYARTLHIWRDNFHANLSQLDPTYDQDLRRKWHFYLSYCEAAFLMRNISVAQLVFTRPNTFNPH